MANFFLDNKDLQYHMNHPLMKRIVELKEKGYADKDLYDYAPTDFEDAQDSYRRVMEIIGEVCGDVIAPNAEGVDHDGPRVVDDHVVYAPGTAQNIEALNQAGGMGRRLIVILNDNGMSITKSVGGVAEHLARQRLKPQYLRFKKGYRKVMSVLPLGGHIYHATHKIKTAIKDSLLPCSLFEDMGFTYLGPVDGHDVKYLTQLLSYAKELNGPVLLHVRTVKGKGYTPAERNPDQFHGVGRFCVETGELVHGSGESFSAVFGETLCSLAEQDGKLCAITAAMQGGTGLNRFARQFPARFFDVGIAEGHAVAMAAGMAKQGMRPVFAVYSSFLQRSYDMLLHDVALQKLHVVLAVDRAGLVGEDGETHHGVFDPAFLDTIPGMTVLCPSSFQELREMLRYAIYDVEGPVAVRYSRGGEGAYQGNVPVEPATLLRTGADITLAGYGMMLNQLLDCADRLARNGIQAEVVKLNAITPIPLERLTASVQKTGRLLVAEDSAAAGGVGQRIAAGLFDAGIQVRGLALANTGHAFVTHGTVPQLQRLCGLDGASLYHRALEVCRHG